jgi:predicted RNA-binding protein with PIN domain
MEEWLIVDGYNVIGAQPDVEWLGDSLEEARDRLVRALSEYQALSGRKVILVFDAHRVPGAGAKLLEQKIIIHYTKQHETADECIEKLVRKLSGEHRRIYVATSDYLEQRLIFGQGAYRISARELLREMKSARRVATREMQERYPPKRPTLGQGLKAEIWRKLEGWRRKK